MFIWQMVLVALGILVLTVEVMHIFMGKNSLKIYETQCGC